MFNKEQIKEFIKINKENNFEDYSLKKFFGKKFFNKLLEAKCIINGYNISPNYFIFNSSNKNKIYDLLKENQFYEMDNNTLWGIKITFSDDIPKEKCIIVAFDQKNNCLETQDNKSVFIFDI